MTSLSLPAARRRFLTMLWLSAALHAAVLGLTRLPPPLAVPLAPELQVSLLQVAPVQPRQALPEAKPELPLRRLLPLPPIPAVVPPTPAPVPLLRVPERMPVSPAPVPVSPAAMAATPSVPTAAATREAPGPQFDIPLLADTRYYSARELDVQPFALRRPEPIYPYQAEAQEVPGRVVIRLHLEADGSVSKTEVVSVSPGGVFGELFRQSTLDSLKTVRFRPAQRNGQAVRAVVEIPVLFEPDR